MGKLERKIDKAALAVAMAEDPKPHVHPRSKRNKIVLTEAERAAAKRASIDEKP